MTFSLKGAAQTALVSALALQSGQNASGRSLLRDLQQTSSPVPQHNSTSDLRTSISDDKTPLWQKVYTCEFDSDCGTHGECVDGPTSEESPQGQSICECEDGFVNDPKTGDVCEYEQLPQFRQTLLSWFTGGLGVDWFTSARGNAEYNAIGATKLLLTAMSTTAGAIGGTCVGGLAGSGGAGAVGGAYAGAVLGGLAQSVWYLADAIRVTASPNNFPDGNGVPLKPF